MKCWVIILNNGVDFYQRSIKPYVQESLEYLSKTAVGRDILMHHDRNLELAKESV